MAKYYWLSAEFLRELTRLLRRERQRPLSRGMQRAYPPLLTPPVNAQRAINVTSAVAVGGYYPATIQFKEAAAWVDSSLTCWAEDIAGGTLEVKRYEGMLVGVHTDGTAIYAVVKGEAGANHNILSTTHTDTSGAGAEATGDVLYRDATGKWTRLPLGSPTQFLGVSGSIVAWQTVPLAAHNLLSTTHADTIAGSGATGDLIHYSGGWTKRAIGSTGQVLTVSGGLPTWAFFNLMSSTIADMGTGGLEATGDTLFRDSLGKWNRLPIGAANEVLTVIGGIPDWVAPAAPGAHAILSATHTDSLAAAVLRGALIVGNATPAWSRLTIGSAGQLLRSDGTDASWNNDLHNLLSSRHGDTDSTGIATGSILYRSAGGIWVVLAIGAASQVLTVSAGLPSWQTPAAAGAHNILSATHTDTSGAGAEATGDVLYRTAGGVWTRLAVGASSNFLGITAGIPAWKDVTVTATPAGADTEIQYNASGAFGAENQFTYEYVGGTNRLSIKDASPPNLAYVTASPGELNVYGGGGDIDERVRLMAGDITTWGADAVQVFHMDSATKNWNLTDSLNLTLGTVTGTKFGTAATEKQGWWGVTPVVQPAGIADADGTLADITTKFNSLLAKMEAMGLLAVA